MAIKDTWNVYDLTEYQKSLKGLKLHLGCNNIYLNNWINYDINNPIADVSGDCLDMHMFEDNTFDLIIASHIIEHLHFTQHFDMMKEWHRVLRPGGEIIIECPDFEKSFKKWLSVDKTDIQGRLDHAPEIFGRGDWNVYQIHQCAIWPEYLEDLLKKVGFSDYRRMTPRADDVQDRCMRMDGRK